ncbi:amino acid ABC transporter ATP-binding/permease protein [Boudabousia marimammalium]|uniref:ABC transporter ATP-binding protein n=1 Tax=Boudabousia marimammalium TaxID=156892 RepID=A0A1Q5PJE5_9ACTO|nr:ABC transporter ATP-binding protein [Boudabousia marimammalium]OKL46005.1 hypothetical protein BM477_07460 [Boudabousia marimammalium]
MSRNEQKPASIFTLTAWMLSLTRPVVAPLAISSLARIADQMLGVVMLAYAGWQVGLFTTGQPGHSWLTVLGIIAGLALVKAFLRYLEQFTGHFVAFKALELLRRFAYEKLYPQAPAISRHARTGDLLSRLTRDIDRIEVFYAHTFAPMMSAIAVPILSAVLAWWLEAGSLALILLGMYVLALVLLIIVGGMNATASSGRILRTRSEIVNQASDIIHGHDEIAGYGLTDIMRGRLNDLNSRLLVDTRRLHTLYGVRRAITFGTMLAMAAVLLVVGAGQVNAGTLTIPALLATVAGGMRGWEAVRGVEDFSTFISQSFASAARLRELAQGEPVPPAGGEELSGSGAVALAAQDVSYAYVDPSGSKHEALRHVSLEVPAGQWHALVGATGCGKSTLATLFARYEDPAEGAIMVAEKDASGIEVASLRAAVVYLSQRTHMFNDTIANNLRLAAPDATDEQLWEVLEVAQIADEIRQMPDGLDTKMGEGGEAVSGGQRQRFGLARALLQHPRALILDEATAHLNDTLAQQVRRAVRNYLGDATILEITHRVSELDGVQKVHVMERGEVVESGIPAELAGGSGAFASLLNRAGGTL